MDATLKQFKAKKLVLATGAQSEKLGKVLGISIPIIPVRGSMWSTKKLSKSDRTADHPLSARVAHRAIMNANLWLLDDFNVFKKEFYILMQKINMTSSENSGVKIMPDKNGDVKVPMYITDRYKLVEQF